MTDENLQISPNYYGCGVCEYYAFTQEYIIEHFYSNHSDKLCNTDNTDENFPFVRHYFYCSKCKYKSTKKSDYMKHCASKKHNRDIGFQFEYACHCGKTYRHRQSLHSHKAYCNKYCESSNTDIDSDALKHTVTNNYQRNDVTNEPLNQTELLVELLKQNQEFKDLIVEERREFQQILTEQNKQLNSQSEKMMELAGNMGNNNTTNSNNNNKFNMNVFLNEKCKDAISLTDFINSMNLSMEDFIQTGELGFVDGLSRVVIEKINDMELCNRPLHCTDLKREVVYIKDAEKWEKDENKTKLRNAIKKIARKNDRMRPIWYETTPGVKTMGTENYEKFFKYSESALGGCGKEETKSFEDKIMKNIMKEVTIDKQMSLE
jgi:hypothetical protein|tara:strand:+ start:703 stop:1830 length:1128 start_codon:yes stop_codon:yes gene_type:complete